MRCTAAISSLLVGDRSRQPVVESSPASRSEALPCRVTIWKWSQSSFCPLPDGSPSREKKSKLRPSLVYQPSRMPENKNACDSLRWGVVEWWGMLLRQRKVDRDVANSESDEPPISSHRCFGTSSSKTPVSGKEGKKHRTVREPVVSQNRENAETKSKKAERPGLRHWRSYRHRTGSRRLSPPFALRGHARTAATNLAGE
jgi:hypothetical protein